MEGQRPGDASVEFLLAHGKWTRLQREYRFEIVDLIEFQPHDASTRHRFVTIDWA